MITRDLCSPNSGRDLADLLRQADVAGTCMGDPVGVIVTALACDSRQVQPGCCYVALRGTVQDGHDYIPAAAAGGARVVVAERPVAAPAGVLVVQVADSHLALARLAAAFHGLRHSGAPANRLRLVGITGTNGKTTVAWLVRSILQAAGERVAMFGTVEYDIAGEKLAAPLTTPDALELSRMLGLGVERGANWGVLEVSSHALEQRRTDGLSFAAGVFTNLSGDHLDYHGSMDAYLRAKKRLFDGLDPSGVAVINGEDPASEKMAADTAGRVIRAGLDGKGADFDAIIISLDARKSVFALRGPGFERRIEFDLIGRHNVMNAVLAAATTRALGVDENAIARGLSEFGGVPGRLQRAEPPGHPFSVFVDYAHTDDALRNVLTALRPVTRRRIICVFGCGGDRDRGKRPRMARAVAEYADMAIVTSDNPRTEEPMAIIEQILPGFEGTAGCEVMVEADRRKAIEGAMACAGAGDTVLIAGKGHETYQIVGRAVLSFDDVAVAREALAAMAVREDVA